MLYWLDLCFTDICSHNRLYEILFRTVLFLANIIIIIRSLPLETIYDYPTSTVAKVASDESYLCAVRSEKGVAAGVRH
jgi:hypothetical protein